MTQTPPPIQDDLLADNVIEQFLLGYDPLLYAADYGLAPEQVWAQIRWTLRVYIQKSMAAEAKLSRKNNGRPRKFASDAERYAYHNARKTATRKAAKKASRKPKP